MMRSKKRSLREFLVLGGFLVFTAGAIFYGRCHQRLVMLVMHQSTSEGEQSSFHPANLKETDGRLDKNVTKAMNILLFYVDDWRHDSLSVARNPIVRNPSIDKLAHEGVRFTHNCVTTIIYWISCATLYTGQYMS